MELMNVLVIGGSGFVGRNLCQYLLQCGHQVTATLRSLDRELIDDDNINYQPLDLLDAQAPRLDLTGMDCVIYLAARAHVLEDASVDPLAEFRKLNLEAAVAIADLAAAQGVKRFVYLSSIGVNGIENDQPFDEEDEPAPCEAYALSKFEAEIALTNLCAKAGLELVILRAPLVYGKHAPGNFGLLVKAVAAGRILPLGGLNNQRSLISIDNLVQLIEICIRHPAAANQLFLVSDDEFVSTSQLIRLIGEAIGKPARLVKIPAWLLKLGAGLLGKSTQARRLCGSLRVDSSKVRNLLGWQPVVSLQQGLKKLR
jgi:nucleoside-diphosphate-sugar epimerase